VVLLGRKDEAFEIVLSYFHSEYLTFVLIACAIFVVFYIILVPVFEGALIQYIDNRERGEASRSDSL